MGIGTAGCVMMLLSGWAVVTDLSSGKIRNYICASGWFAGLFLAAGGAISPAEWAGGAALPLLAGWLLFRRRLMGAGDIKLLSALGGLCGMSGLLPYLLLVFLAGSGLSVLLLVREKDAAARIHFSVPILMGSALWLAVRG